ncbi:MAG: hypothetical protein IPI97_12370 [Nitrosomonas sp.]|nr:hypothetical protein [Nitrosomonas sp.]MBK7365747.1 hypothetical protein [Nitrosomonas sp.]
MLRKLFTTLGFGASAMTTSEPPYTPYQSEAANEIYNLLFCDNLAAFKPKEGESAATWQTVLFAEPADRSALLALANDITQEGRIRYLAHARLRSLGENPPAKVLLGVIAEVSLADGLDTLAAYSEGGVRYINHTGELVISEGPTDLAPHVQKLLAASEPVVARIGPWKQPRRSPPKSDNVRLTFLVSDGLYFGEGLMSIMQHEEMAGPVIQCATTLLQTVVSVASK